MSMSADDEGLLQAYLSAQAFAADMIRKMGGDPKRPTRKQAEAVAKMLLDRAMAIKSIVDPDSPTPTAESILRDYEHVERLKKGRH